MQSGLEHKPAYARRVSIAATQLYGGIMTSSKTRKSFAWLAALLILLTFVSAARAQSAVDGAVGGSVLDSSGAVVANASVTVLNIGTNAQQQAVTDASGYFRVIHLQ